MKSIQDIRLRTTLLLMVAILTQLSCERDLSSEAEYATFAKTGPIFTDTPIALGSDFYFPFLGSKATAFSVDDSEGYESDASIRIDVPNADDPDGNYAGAIFRVEGEGRNLTDFDALTFWAKATQGVTIGEMGFGQDFEENKFQVTRTNVRLGTTWTKYVIPIPDPSKLLNERGMFWYAAGTQETGGSGYTFWLDEVQFEKLGTIAQSSPAISGGLDGDLLTTPGESFKISGLLQTFDVASQGNITMSIAPSYFTFNSSNKNVAVVDDLGEVTIFGTGNSLITADLADVRAKGSINVEAFDEVPLISLFSDLYANVPVDNYNGFYQEFQTTLGGAVDEGGNQIIDYTLLNFVAIEFYGRDGSSVQPVDASEMTHLHIEIRANENVDPSDFIKLELHNNFTLANSSAGSFSLTGADLASNDWVAFDIPLADFTGLSAKNALGALFVVSDATIANVSLDNIYFYKE